MKVDIQKLRLNALVGWKEVARRFNVSVEEVREWEKTPSVRPKQLNEHDYKKLIVFLEERAKLPVEQREAINNRENGYTGYGLENCVQALTEHTLLPAPEGLVRMEREAGRFQVRDPDNYARIFELVKDKWDEAEEKAEGEYRYPITWVDVDPEFDADGQQIHYEGDVEILEDAQTGNVFARDNMRETESMFNATTPNLLQAGEALNEGEGLLLSDEALEFMREQKHNLILTWQPSERDYKRLEKQAAKQGIIVRRLDDDEVTWARNLTAVGNYRYAVAQAEDLLNTVIRENKTAQPSELTDEEAQQVATRMIEQQREALEQVTATPFEQTPAVERRAVIYMSLIDAISEEEADRREQVNREAQAQQAQQAMQAEFTIRKGMTPEEIPFDMGGEGDCMEFTKPEGYDEWDYLQQGNWWVKNFYTHFIKQDKLIAEGILPAKPHKLSQQDQWVLEQNLKRFTLEQLMNSVNEPEDLVDKQQALYWWREMLEADKPLLKEVDANAEAFDKKVDELVKEWEQTGKH